MFSLDYLAYCKKVPGMSNFSLMSFLLWLLKVGIYCDTKVSINIDIKIYNHIHPKVTKGFALSVDFSGKVLS